MAQGRTLTLVPEDKELTTQQPADILSGSRPHLIKLLEQQQMPFHYVGQHRRIRVDDLLAHQQRRNSERRRHLRDLTRLSAKAAGGYY